MEVKSWADVTVGQFIELSSVTPDDFETSIDYTNFVIQVLSDIDIDTVEDMSFDEYERLTSIYSFISTCTYALICAPTPIPTHTPTHAPTHTHTHSPIHIDTYTSTTTYPCTST